MSLKVFHIFFIISSITLALGLGVLSLKTFLTSNNPMYLVVGLLSFILGIALLGYGVWFLQELKKLK